MTSSHYPPVALTQNTKTNLPIFEQKILNWTIWIFYSALESPDVLGQLRSRRGHEEVIMRSPNIRKSFAKSLFYENWNILDISAASTKHLGLLKSHKTLILQNFLYLRMFGPWFHKKNWFPELMNIFMNINYQKDTPHFTRKICQTVFQNSLAHGSLVVLCIVCIKYALQRKKRE